MKNDNKLEIIEGIFGILIMDAHKRIFIGEEDKTIWQINKISSCNGIIVSNSVGVK